jgi:hypothetical protein
MQKKLYHMLFSASKSVPRKSVVQLGMTGDVQSVFEILELELANFKAGIWRVQFYTIKSV